MLLWERKKFVEKGIDNHHLLVTIFVYTRVIYNTRTKYIVHSSVCRQRLELPVLRSAGVGVHGVGHHLQPGV